MPHETEELVSQLANAVNWHSAARTYGSYHSTLIGLVVEAWTRSENDRCALEGAPRIEGYNSDAILAHDGRPVGVVEVEGFNILEKIQHFHKYFASERLSQPVFGLALIYQQVGDGYSSPGKNWLDQKDIVNEARLVGEAHPANPFMLVLAKKCETPEKHGPHMLGLCSTNGSAQYRLEKVTGRVFYDGQEGEEQTLWSS